ncbi:OsmC family protein [Dechloromonas denitrificans]|uniref:OsmC family protein n=1 Tax=Dechloromonas denitrificans TaxID=281362 RepID=UPI001CF82D53|nr:OsmC family protein [Dechloromonas denitrificans]UCV11215.1 OsmC family protein [Dechloromonas denitrificans]
MYATVVDSTPRIKVTTSKFEADYALDGSLMNPLEAFYASLAACAAVFAKKACKALGTSAAGIEINCKPFAGPGGPLTLAKFKTEVRFPAGFTAEQKAAVLDSIVHCAVKEVVADGPNIEFLVEEV